ncbi:MAG: HD-GYP domain-containing protein [Pelomonas sp.]|nr:HD-GYP domain-containing protein [Roseateles sp.]
MLKKIATSQVALGMYIQSFEGSWLNHPFWKSRFVLTDTEDLAALRASGVAGVWIDVSKGDDVPGAAPPAATPVAAAPAVPTASAVPRATAPTRATDEIEQAARVLRQSKGVVTQLFADARLGKVVTMEACVEVVSDISASVMRNSSALISLARLKNKDEYTYMHSVSVCALMVALARELGLDEATTREAGVAGLLHDIGKMLVPDHILNKPGRLSDDEFAQMRTHPERGHAALVRSGNVPDAALDVCLHHHERFDGSGYPQGLAGDKISLLARMGSVCDVYDAITSDRPYKQAWRAADSLGRMAQWQGHFDTQIFHAFVRTVGIYPMGTLVKLQSGNLAVVIDQNARDLTRPLVRVFFSTRSNQRVPPYELDLARETEKDRVVGREDPLQWGFGRLDELWRPASAAV